MSAFRGDFPPCTSQQTLCKQHQLEVIRARQAAWMKQRAEALEDSVTTTTVPSSVSVRSSSRSEQPPLNDVVVPQKAHPPPLLEDERVGLDSSKLPPSVVANAVPVRSVTSCVFSETYWRARAMGDDARGLPKEGSQVRFKSKKQQT